MKSIRAVAELAWRQLNPQPGDEVLTLKEEMIETAKNEFAGQAWVQYVNARKEGDKAIFESMLRRKVYLPEESVEGLFVQLDETIIDLPNDEGIRLVAAVTKGARPFTKGRLESHNLFADDHGEKTYYRLQDKIFFPDGLNVPGSKISVSVLLVTAGALNEDDLLVPAHMASAIHDALLQKYQPTRNIPSNVTNDQNPNT